MEGLKIVLPETSGFHQLTKVPKQNQYVVEGTSLTAYIPKVNAFNDYVVGEATKVTGVCYYHLLMYAGTVRGVLFATPKLHTVLTPILLKVGPCPEPFKLNTNLQQTGLLIYESQDSSVLVIPTEVKSPLLVEVDT